MDLLKPVDAQKRRVTMLATERWLMAAGLKALGYSINSKDEGEGAQANEQLVAAHACPLRYAVVRALAEGGRPEGARLLHQQQGRGRGGQGQGPADRGQAVHARL